jgi:hypothetical protein
MRRSPRNLPNLPDIISLTTSQRRDKMTVSLEAVKAAIQSGELDSDLGALNTLVESRLATSFY